MREVTRGVASLCRPSLHPPNPRRFMTIVEKGRETQQQQNEIINGMLSYIPHHFPFLTEKVQE